MSMSEEEARTKWCPQVRIAGDNFPAGMEPDASLPKAYLCRGSDCAAWRTSGLMLSHGGGTGDRTHGYCGLAGRPAAS